MAGSDRVIPIVCTWGRFNIFAYYIDGPQPALIDTGITHSPTEEIAPTLGSLGLRLEDVKWILLTHGHPDHLGGTHEAWEATGQQSEVVIHEADAALLRERSAHVDVYKRIREPYVRQPDGAARQESMLLEVIGNEMQPTQELVGGERLSLGGGLSLDVVHTPGHSPGSVSFVFEDQAFVGDAVQLSGGANLFPVIEDPAAYRKSVRTLLEDVRPGRLHLGHRFHDSDGTRQEAQIEGPDVERVLRRSLEIESRLADVARRHMSRGLPADDADSRYGPFAAIAEDLGYTGDPTMEPSPFFVTMHGYRQEFEPADGAR